MQTSKPISTISYNSQEYLIARLEELIQAHTISDYMFINHFAEADEKKNHIHLYIEPNKKIDTMSLQEFFNEFDASNPDKPFKCINFKSSKVDDWILYVEHFAPYLATKGESREFHYTKDDFVYYDGDTFDDLYHHAHYGSEWAHRNQILLALSDGKKNPSNLILNGTIPLTLACQINAFDFMRKHYSLTRGSHDGHE